MKILKRVSIAVIAVYLLLICMITAFQEKIIFRSETLPQDHVFTSSIPFEELYLKASDDAIIHGLHYQQAQPKGVILYFHGNARTLDYWGEWAETLATKYQHDVVIMDYRGYGKSLGKRSHAQMLKDALLFYDYAHTKFTEEDITIFGRSLGGAFATHTATQRNAKQLLLESTFTSVYDIGKQRFWFLPLKWLLRFPFQNIQNVQHIEMPTHIIHGTQDAVVPYKHGQKLYKKSNSDNKQFYTIQNGAHNDLISFEDYFKVLDTIFQ